MRYLNPLRYIHYHTQLAIPTIYDESLSFYEIMNKTNLHFNEVINDMNENYEIIDKAFQEVLEQTNKWMEEAKAQADRAEQEANKSQASAEASQQAAEDARNQADRAKSEADAAAASAVEAQNQADRASSEADRAHTEAENAKAQAQAAANSAQESATSAAASAGSASESAASATESKNSADASANSASQAAQSATASQNSAEASANSASQAAQSATASQNSAEASANSASQAAQSATDAANSAKEAADTLDEAKETFVKKAGDTMTGKLTISYGGLSVDGSADISGDLNTGRLQVGKPGDHRDTHLYGNLYLNDMLNMSIGSNVALKFANLQDGLKLYAPLSFEPSPLRISNVGNPQNDFDAVNKITLDSKVTGINAELTDVNNQIAALTTRMGTAEKNITKNTSDIASLTNRVTTNETSINNINTEITNIKQDITTVEGDYVKKAGDTMTGNLTMGLNQIVMDTGHIVGGNNTLLFEGYPLIDVDGAKISMVGDPVEGMDAANKEYVDNAVAGVKPTGDYLPLTGGTMSGDINMGVNNSVRFGAANYALYQNKGTGHLVLTGNSNTDIVEMNNIGTLQFGNQTTIQNVKTPTNNGDAAPKSYVDGQISIAKNDVYEQIHNYLPLTGGTLTGAVRFGTTASIGELLDFGLVAKMDSGNLGIVTQTIIHTNDSTSTDGVTYTLANVDSDIHYTCAGNGVKQMNIGSFETVKVSSSLLVAEDPTQNMQVATKQYVDQHAGGGEQTYYDTSAQMVFKIKLLHETTGLYTCDCYYIANSTKYINISSGEMSGFMEVPHTLSSFLNENGYTFERSNINFVSFASDSSGFCSNQLCSLGEQYVTLWCTSPTPVSSGIKIPFNLNNGFLCSAILRK
nr:MAG TPA: hyaluronase tail fiber protein [Caudoviricetes sp.]